MKLFLIFIFSFMFNIMSSTEFNAHAQGPNDPNMDTQNMAQERSEKTTAGIPKCTDCATEGPIVKLPDEFSEFTENFKKQQLAKKEAAQKFLFENQNGLRCMTTKGSYKGYTPPMSDTNNGTEYLFNRYKHTFNWNTKNINLPNNQGTVSRSELFAVESLARTLIGEMRSCDGQFKPEYVEVVARTILNRAEECTDKECTDKECTKKMCGYVSNNSTLPKNFIESIPNVIAENDQYNNWHDDDNNNMATLCPSADPNTIDPNTQKAILDIALEVVFNTENFKTKTASVGDRSFSFKSLKGLLPSEKKSGLNDVDKETHRLRIEKIAKKNAFPNTRLKKDIIIKTNGSDVRVNNYNCLAVYEEDPSPER